MKKHGIIILDFGSQYTQLIVKCIREMNVYAEIIPYYTSLEKIISYNAKGIILSGSPSSIYKKNSCLISKKIFDLGLPIFGICYGMQLISYLFNGIVIKGKQGEYGHSNFIIDDLTDLLLYGVPKTSTVWMSHFDKVDKKPDKFKIIGHTEHCIAAISYKEKNIYAVQFHPEVLHTTYGKVILYNFIFRICHCKINWELNNFIQESIEKIQKTVKNKKVILAFSCGIDSSVSAILIHKAIGNSLICIFIDTGLLPKNDITKIINIYKTHYNLNIHCLNFKNRFLSILEGVVDPEKKRKIIGFEFISIFQEESLKIPETNFLAQGTIYSDVIESTSIKGLSSLIKSHHNVGGLPNKMHLKLLEPLRNLLKDEVRKVAINLGIPKKIVYRHPFPGPGMSIRIIGEVTKKKIDILNSADTILIEELKISKLYYKVNQAFVILLPIKSVGIMGDTRTYKYVAVLRIVNTTDFMTATWSHLPYNFLEKVSKRIINEVNEINRVTYDISSKPPSTIEWE